MTRTSCTQEQWKIAQRDELAFWSQGSSVYDWSDWWMEKFDLYSFVPPEAQTILEVGCGPYANNLMNIVNRHPRKLEIYLEDTLMDDFRGTNQPVASIPASRSWMPLEELRHRWPGHMDVLVCINVLDHVFDLPACLDSLYALLSPGGMLILGQDLTSEHDLHQCPEMRDDPMHPIKVGLEDVAPFLMTRFNTTFLNLLPREQGRNPKAHYATLCWAGVKR